MTTKRNPTDSTLRNIQSANKKIAALVLKLKALSARVKTLEKKLK